MLIKTRIKLFWHRLWVRKDEFHDSLDLLPVAELLHMTRPERKAYYQDLIKRRNKAHEKDRRKTSKSS